MLLKLLRKLINKMVMTLLTRPKKTVATKVIATDGSGDFNTNGTDDQVEIQAAIDSLPATGGCIYMKEGTYTITASIVLPSNIGLIGCGPSTILDGSGFAVLDNILESNTQDNILIDKLYFLGNVNFTIGIHFTTVTDSVISNCWFDTCYEGIEFITNSDRILVYSNHAVDCDDAYYLNGTSNSILINNTAITSVSEGFYIQGNNNIVSSNISYSNGDNGFECNGDYYHITNNLSYSNGDYGINLSGSNDSVICNNVSYSNGFHGIWLTGVNNSTISNNTCYDNDVGNTASYDGICILGDYNVIASNRCRENDRYEINILHSSCDKNLVEGNICIGADHVGTINDAGTDTQIFNNIET